MDMKYLPIGRPAAALVGAVLMVAFHVVKQPDVYRIEGEMANLQTIYLLIGMMVLSYFFDREGLLTILSVKIFGQSLSLRKILWRVCVLSAALSAFITNDAACLLIAPLVLNMYVKQRRSPKEFLPLTLGIATSANIGSASTIFGNPQNVIIAAKGSVNLSDFFIAALPTAILAVFLNIGLLYLIFCRTIFGNASNSSNEDEPLIIDNESDTSAPSLIESRTSWTHSHDSSSTPHHTSQIAIERETTYTGTHLQTTLPVPITKFSGDVTNRSDHSRSIRLSNSSGNRMRNRDYGDGTVENQLDININNVVPLKDRKITEKLFIAWLIFISILLVVLLAINVPQLKKRGIYFNLGTTTAAAAVLTMLMDSILNRKYQHDAMIKVDWTVILLFIGLFVWIEGFKNTCIPLYVFDLLKDYMNLTRPEGVIVFSIFVVVGSNVFSNVPLVILLIDHIDKLGGNETCNEKYVKIGALLLAWTSTIAGNLTLFGSIANLIVADKAKKSEAKYELSFLRYLPYGLISTTIITITTVPIVYFLGVAASKIT